MASEYKIVADCKVVGFPYSLYRDRFHIGRYETADRAIDACNEHIRRDQASTQSVRTDAADVERDHYRIIRDEFVEGKPFGLFINGERIGSYYSLDDANRARDWHKLKESPATLFPGELLNPADPLRAAVNRLALANADVAAARAMRDSALARLDQAYIELHEARQDAAAEFRKASGENEDA